MRLWGFEDLPDCVAESFLHTSACQGGRSDPELYLEVRRNLSGVVLMIDSRLGFTDLDRQLLSFVAPRVGNGSVKLLVLLTKADKLNRKEAAEALRTAQEVLGELATDEADLGIALFSALKKSGVGDAALVLHGWTHGVEGPR